MERMVRMEVLRRFTSATSAFSVWAVMVMGAGDAIAAAGEAISSSFIVGTDDLRILVLWLGCQSGDGLMRPGGSVCAHYLCS